MIQDHHPDTDVKRHGGSGANTRTRDKSGKRREGRSNAGRWEQNSVSFQNSEEGQKRTQRGRDVVGDTKRSQHDARRRTILGQTDLSQGKRALPATTGSLARAVPMAEQEKSASEAKRSRIRDAQTCGTPLQSSTEQMRKRMWNLSHSQKYLPRITRIPRINADVVLNLNLICVHPFHPCGLR